MQKFCTGDGPGIRTTVFLKGCPLHCLWCHNPESQAVKPEILFNVRKCIGCGACVSSCPNHCHDFVQGRHTYNRQACAGCTTCVESCYTGALETAGTEMSVAEVMQAVLKEKLYYEGSGGGMTLSGGEPMAQFEFTRSLLTAAKENGLHTCMETCGFAPWERYSALLDLTDLFLLDYKLTDDTLHKQYTGVSRNLIWENMHRIDDAGGAIVLRCPIIPTVNDTAGHFAGIAAMANSLKHVKEIDIEPYHPLGSEKSAQLGRQYGLAQLTFPPAESIAGWIKEIQAQTQVPVIKA